MGIECLTWKEKSRRRVGLTRKYLAWRGVSTLSKAKWTARLMNFGTKLKRYTTKLTNAGQKPTGGASAISGDWQGTGSNANKRLRNIPIIMKVQLLVPSSSCGSSS